MRAGSLILITGTQAIHSLDLDPTKDYLIERVSANSFCVTAVNPSLSTEEVTLSWTQSGLPIPEIVAFKPTKAPKKANWKRERLPYHKR